MIDINREHIRNTNGTSRDPIKFLKIAQLNCHGSETVSCEARVLAQNQEISIFLVQEPWRQGIDRAMGSMERVVRCKDPVRVRAAIYITDRNIKTISLPENNQDMACCLIEWADKQIILASVYFDRRRDVQEDISRIRRLLEKHGSRNVIIGGDFNNHHPA